MIMAAESANSLESKLESLSDINDVAVTFSYGSSACNENGLNTISVEFRDVKINGKSMTDTTSLSFLPLLHVPLSKIYVCDDDFNGTGSLYVENNYVDTPTPIFVGNGQPSILSVEWQPGPGMLQAWSHS